jgi:pimeloyl-ACP methyl ester carboxylesterase
MMILFAKGKREMRNVIYTLIANDIDRYVTHGYADSNGVRIHYACIGEGPLVIMLHGFPDFWYTWRKQMVALASHYQVVALDLRGYNLSDKPHGGEHYSMRYLIGDVQAVIRHFGRDKAIIAGHDWGAAISWQFAMHLPALTERLIILNLPHPRCMIRELAHNPQQQENSAYARNFQQEDAHKQLTPESLSAWVQDPAVRAHYIEAFQRSDREAMLHYYKQNYPRPPYQDSPAPVKKVQAPVLQIHGLQDQFLLPGGLNDTWQWLENDWTLLTIPQAGHFVQHDAPELVTHTIVNWLAR